MYILYALHIRTQVSKPYVGACAIFYLAKTQIQRHRLSRLITASRLGFKNINHFGRSVILYRISRSNPVRIFKPTCYNRFYLLFATDNNFPSVTCELWLTFVVTRASLLPLVIFCFRNYFDNNVTSLKYRVSRNRRVLRLHKTNSLLCEVF